jgi:sec-independent protein translocase protein TatC
MQSNMPSKPAEDLFESTRMSFGEHLDDLRRHFWRAIVGFAAILSLCFCLDFVGSATGWPIGVGKPVQAFIARPIEQALRDFHEHRTGKVMANWEQDPMLCQANRPTEFVRLGFLREQLLALLAGQPVAEINQFPAPSRNSGEGRAAEECVVRLWIRHEEPLVESAALQAAHLILGRRSRLATLSVTEAMFVYFKVTLACGFILGSPWIFWQIWSFIAAGLYPHEKRPIQVWLPGSLALFGAGILFCQVLVIPKAIEALLWFNEWLDLEPDIRLSEWLGFAVLMPLVFGISFQLPLAMLVVERLGLVSSAVYLGQWRLAFFPIEVFAAVITPTTDPVNMQLLAVPLFGLYGLGILLCRLPSSSFCNLANRFRSMFSRRRVC